MLETIKSISRSKWINPFSVFLILMLAMTFILGFHKVIFLEPFGIHFIRQTDCLAFVEGYKLNGYSFFEPAILNLSSTDGKAACEFPILYYLTALLSNVFGNEAFLLRLFSYLLYCFGMYHFFSLIYRHFQSYLLASAMTVLLGSSTVLIYYSINFLPDVPAFGLCLAASCILIQQLSGKQPENRKSVLFAYGLFSLGCLIKVTFLIYPISFCIVSFISSRRSDRKASLFKVHAIGVSICLVLGMAWYAYASFYNSWNHSNYFLTTWTPLWQKSWAEISALFTHILGYWRVNYYYETTLHVITALFFLILIAGKRKLDIFWHLLISMITGCLFYVFFFFEKFRDHDYYFIELIPLIAIIFYNSAVYLKVVLVKVRSLRIVATTSLMVLALLSFNYGMKKYYQRVEAIPDLYSIVGAQLYETQTEIETLHLDKNGLFAVYGDKTMNGSLYFLQKQGITLSNESLMKTDVNTIEVDDCQYHLVLDSAVFSQYAPLDDHLDQIGSINGFRLYELKAPSE